MDEEALDWLGGPCWFCERRAPVAGRSYVVRMLKVTDIAHGLMSVLKTTVSVPRCSECRAGHWRVNTLAVAVATACAAGVLVVLLGWKPFDLPGWGVAIAVLLGASPGAAITTCGIGLPVGQKCEKAAADYPGVVAMKQGGWTIEDPQLRPPGSQ